jgi:hypothetical protein
VRWLDFTSSNSLDSFPFLRDYANEPFYLDLPDQPDQKPVLYFIKSKDFERLPLILDDRPRRGSELALHNAERTVIWGSIWISPIES